MTKVTKPRKPKWPAVGVTVWLENGVGGVVRAVRTGEAQVRFATGFERWIALEKLSPDVADPVDAETA